jgi:capsular polysaccharide biosynthesis protein
MDATQKSNVETAGGNSFGRLSIGGGNPAPIDGGTPSRLRNVPEFTDLVLACTHRPLRVLITGCSLSALLILIAWTLTSPIFRAEGLVRVREEQDVVFSAQISRASDASFFRSQEKLVLSPLVLAEALEDPSLQAVAFDMPDHGRIEWLRSYLDVQAQSGSEVMTITASNPSAVMAQRMATAVTNAYFAEITDRLQKDRQLRERELEQAAQQADARLDQLWDELNKIAETVGSDSSQSLTIRDELQFQAYRDYSKQLQTAQLRGDDLRRQLAELQSQSVAAADDLDQIVDALLRENPEVELARQRLIKTELEIQQVKKLAAEVDTPRFARLFADRDHYENELNQVVDRLKPQMIERSRQLGQKALNNSISQLERQIELCDAEKEFLRARIIEIDNGLATESESGGVKLDMQRHAVDRQTRLADELWQSLQELRIESQSQPRVTLISLPDIPAEADKSRRLKASLALGGLGWMMSILMVGYVEWNDCRIRYVSDVANRSKLPVFGLGVQNDRSMMRAKRSLPANSVREAAARLMLLANERKQIPSLMIASAVTEEPSHLIAIEMVEVFAKFKRRTLLIDCTPKSSELGQQLSVGGSLASRPAKPPCEPQNTSLAGTKYKAVDYLPLTADGDDDTWLDPIALKSVLDRYRNAYEAIIVHGPGLMSSAESLLLASQVDLTILAVFLNISKWDQLLACEQAAHQAEVALGGAIIHSGKSRIPLPHKPNNERERSTNDEYAESLRIQIQEMQAELDSVNSENVRDQLSEKQFSCLAPLT